MPTPTILSLRCPGCGGALHGLSQDVVFWCDGCGGLHEVVQDAFLGRVGSWRGPSSPPRDRSCTCPCGLPRGCRLAVARSQRAASAAHIAAFDWVYVTGFALHNGFYFGDPGVIFTQKRVALTAAEPAPILGCTRGLEAAKAYIEPHLLTIMDRQVDVTGLELACTIGEAVLWGIPYYDEGDALCDGILGLRIPAAAVDEIGSFGHG